MKKEKHRLWLSAVNRKDFDPPADAWICSEHFTGCKSNLGPNSICYCYYYCNDNYGSISPFVGEKSKAKDSPAYMPSLFSFTDAPVKHKAEKDMARWEAAKEDDYLRI